MSYSERSVGHQTDRQTEADARRSKRIKEKKSKNIQPQKTTQMRGLLFYSTKKKAKEKSRENRAGHF